MTSEYGSLNPAPSWSKTQVVGDVRHDDVDSGSPPVLVGGVASATVPRAVSSGDRVRLWFDLYGRVITGDGMTHGTLADGQLAASETDVYTAPSGGARVNFMRCTNPAVTVELVKVWVKRSGGTSRLIAAQSLAQYDRLDVIEPGEELELSSGDKIRALSTNATTVDYIVSGSV